MKYEYLKLMLKNIILLTLIIYTFIIENYWFLHIIVKKKTVLNLVREKYIVKRTFYIFGNNSAHIHIYIYFFFCNFKLSARVYVFK